MSDNQIVAILVLFIVVTLVWAIVDLKATVRGMFKP